MLTLEQLEQEHVISKKDVAKHPVYRNPDGKPAHPSVVHRHFTQGVIGPNGERICLEFAQTPRGRVTTREALARFLSALNGHQHSGSNPRTVSQQSKQSAKADRELAAAGW